MIDNKILSITELVDLDILKLCFQYIHNLLPIYLRSLLVGNIETCKIARYSMLPPKDKTHYKIYLHP